MSCGVYTFDSSLKQKEIMKTYMLGKEYEVKQSGNRFYYYSIKAGRWLPIKKEHVDFSK
jgi:hypothetical protein